MNKTLSIFFFVVLSVLIFNNPCAWSEGGPPIRIYPVSPVVSRIKTIRYADFPPDGELKNRRVALFRPAGVLGGTYMGKEIGYAEPIVILKNRNGSYIFPPKSERFSYTNLFYHANEASKFFERLGYAPQSPVMVLGDFAVRGAPQYREFSALKNRPWIRMIAGKEVPVRLNGAKNAVVIGHEMAHIVLRRVRRINRNLVGSDAPFWQAYSEAFADYFGSAYAGRTDPGRNISKYPKQASWGNIHTIGHAYAHELWKFRSALQRKGFSAFEADRIVFNSLLETGAPIGNWETWPGLFIRRLWSNLPDSIRLNPTAIFKRFK